MKTIKSIGLIKIVFCALLSLIIIQGQAFASPTSVAHYTMDEGQGYILHDSSGDNNHGTISGASWTTGSYLAFDGISDYVTVASSPSLNPTEALTVMAWVKWDIDPISGLQWASIVNKNVDNQYRLHHNHENTAFEFAIRTTSGNKWVESVTMPQIDHWYHITGTYDGSALKMYIDGQLENEVAHSGTILKSNSSLDIGRRAGSADRYFSGAIGDVRIYDIALTDQEIYTIATVIPEPTTLTLTLLGIGGLALIRKKASNKIETVR